VKADAQVPDGEVTAQGTMSVDVDCDGSIDTFAFSLVDTAVFPGCDAPVAEWSGQIASWWNLLVTVDPATGEPFDMGADLTTANDPDRHGFRWFVEDSAGTSALDQRGNDARPADVNNDAFSDLPDVSALTANFGLAIPPVPPRDNIAPDPVDGFVDISDVTRMTGFFGRSCTVITTPTPTPTTAPNTVYIERSIASDF